MKTNWTGERLETFINNETTIEHLHRYAVAMNFVKEKIVLDIASGEGYGSNILSYSAKIVKGVDIDQSAVENANKRYKKSNLEFTKGSTSNIPFKDNYFDIVVSYETIEHHNEHIKMMEEIKRVLKPEGILIISSPDKLNYSDRKNYKNRFHVKELYIEEFKHLINSYFNIADFYLQKSTFASILVAENTPNDFVEYSGDFNSIKLNQDFQPHYILAIASDFSIPKLNVSTFTDNHFIGRNESQIGLIYRQSWSYKIGKFILSPISYVKRVYERFKEIAISASK